MLERGGFFNFHFWLIPGMRTEDPSREKWSRFVMRCGKNNLSVILNDGSDSGNVNKRLDPFLSGAGSIVSDITSVLDLVVFLFLVLNPQNLIRLCREMLLSCFLPRTCSKSQLYACVKALFSLYMTPR